MLVSGSVKSLSLMVLKSS